MILLIDNNLPPFLAETMNPLAEQGGHRVEHIRRRYTPEEHAEGVPDERWMRDLSGERDAAFLTLDLKITKRPPELAVFRDSDLVGFWLRAKAWSQLLAQRRHHELASRLLMRWPDIVSAVEVIGSQSLEIPLTGKIKGLR